MVNNSSKKSIAMMLIAGIAMFFTSFIFAVMIALFPLGFIAKAIIFAVAFFAIIIAWGLRAKGNKVPDRFIFGLMMSIVVLSIAWPRYVFFSVGGLPGINPQSLSVLVGLGLVLIFSIYSPDFSKRVIDAMKNGKAILKLAFILWLWRFIANFLGEYPVESTVDYLRETLSLSSFILFGSVIASYDNGPKKMLHFVMLAALFVGIAGFVEAFQHKNIFVGFASQNVDASVAKILDSIASDKSRGGVYRVQSVFGHPILYAQFFSALVPLALYGVMYEKKWVWRALSLIIIPIALFAILKSGSRSGIASFVVTIGFLGVLFWFRAMLHGQYSKFVAILALPLLALALGFASYVLQELAAGSNQSESSSTEVRNNMLHNAIEALWESPLWGFGKGTAIEKAGVLNTKGVATLDNYFLNIAVDAGYVGLILFLALIVFFGYKGFKYAALNDGNDGMFVGACTASVLGMFATFYIVSIHDSMTFVWLLITATFPYLAKSKQLKFKG